MSYILENEPKCKSCGADEKRIVLDYKHINGKRKETVEYECGLVIEYVPSFDKIHVVKQCNRTHEYSRMKERERKLYEHLVSIVNEAQVSNEYKRKILSRLEYVK